MKDPLTQLLDDAKEIIESGKGTRTELAGYLGVPPQRVSEWIFSRNPKPNADRALLIKRWVERKNQKTPKERTR